MSTGALSREFRLAYVESPYGYLMTRRIERAMAPLSWHLCHCYFVMRTLTIPESNSTFVASHVSGVVLSQA